MKEIEEAAIVSKSVFLHATIALQPVEINVARRD
jgi:hypothetical protein